MKKIAHSCLISAALIGCGLNAQLVQYVDGSSNYTTTAPNLTSTSNFTASSLSSFGDIDTESDWTRTNFGTGRDSLAGPTAGSSAASEWLFGRLADIDGSGPHYYTFTVTADSGYTLDLTTLSFDQFLSINSPAITETGTTSIQGTWDLQANVDGAGFSSIDSGSNTLVGVFGTNTYSDVYTESVDLGLISGASEVEFRLLVGGVGTGGDGLENRSALWTQGITLEGSVAAIPEPSEFGLLAGALGLLAIGLRRRRTAKDQ